MAKRKTVADYEREWSAMEQRDPQFAVPRPASREPTRLIPRGDEWRVPNTTGATMGEDPTSLSEMASVLGGALRRAPQGVAPVASLLGNMGKFVGNTALLALKDRFTGGEEAYQKVANSPGIQQWWANAKAHPANELANLIPLVGDAKGVGDMVREAALARRHGDEAAAQQYEGMLLPTAAIGLIPEAGGAAISKLRGAERLAGRSAVDAFATSERVPYAGSGHLSGLLDDAAERERYSADPRAQWTDAKGDDILYKALGMEQRPTRPATGVYDPPSGTGVETNPATVGMPQTSWHEGDVPALDRQKMNAAEAIRAYTDAQGAGAWHVPGAATRGGNSGTSLFIPHSGPASKETLMGMREAGAPHGLPDVVDTGEGITLSNFYPGPPEADALKTSLGGDLGEYLRSVSGEEPRRRHVASGYRSMFEGIEDPVTGQMRIPEPGSGEITKKLEDLLAEYPDAVHQLDTPEFRQRALSGAALDDATAAQGLGVARPDIQRARRLIGKYGLKGLFDARKAGAAVPSLAALMGAYGLAQPSDGSGY